MILTNWCIYASQNYAIIDLDNDLSPIRRQAIIWTYDGLLFIMPRGTNFGEIWMNIFIQGNALWYVVCKMVATLAAAVTH